MHTQTPVYPPNMCPPHAHARSCELRVSWSNVGALVQVAMTDLEDVVDGGGQRLACGGYV